MKSGILKKILPTTLALSIICTLTTQSCFAMKSTFSSNGMSEDPFFPMSMTNEYSLDQTSQNYQQAYGDEESPEFYQLFVFDMLRDMDEEEQQREPYCQMSIQERREKLIVQLNLLITIRQHVQQNSICGYLNNIIRISKNDNNEVLLKIGEFFLNLYNKNELSGFLDKDYGYVNDQLKKLDKFK